VVRFFAWLCALSVLAFSSVGLALPKIEHPVEDEAGVLDAASKEKIAARLVAVRAQAQIAVLLVKTTQPQPIEDFSIKVAEQWRGGQKDKNNGVLIVIAVGDHRTRIEVGYGLEPVLTDARCKRILDDARPKLRASDYGGAVLQIVEQVIALATGSAPSDALAAPAPAPAPTPAPTPAPSPTPSAGGIGFAIAFMLVMAFLFVGAFGLFIWLFFALAQRAALRASGWTANGWRPYVVPIYTADNSSSWSSSSSDSSSSSSNDSSFSSSSGDSSFSSNDTSFSGGGGDFGGGGASSSW
jgi:uncharacterized protein